MSDTEQVDRLQELTNKLARCSKNVKLLLDKTKLIDEKIDGAIKKHLSSSKEEEKDKIDKIFEKKATGRRVGSFESKQNQTA